MVSQSNHPNYRVILCHYNEIGLKSDAYKTKLEESLIAQIKKICKREKLNLQSVLNLQNRLLFFFPSDQMEKVITVFRNVIGIQSISPAITSDRDLNNVKDRARDYGIQVLPSNTPFWVKFKSISALSQRFEEIEKEIAKEIQDGCEKAGKGCKSNKKKPKITIYVEMREKGAYIYHLKIPTSWGGMPLELSRALIAEWLGSPYDGIASHLLHHRGSLVFPILFNFGTFTPTIDKTRVKSDLTAIAKFYADPVTYFTVNFEKIMNWIQMQTKSGQRPCFLCNAVRSRFFLNLLKFNSENQLMKINDYIFYPKALISTLNDTGFDYMSFFQSKDLPVFYPLTSFKESELDEILKLILNTEELLFDYNEIPTDSSFDLPRLINNSPELNNASISNTNASSTSCPIQSECLLFRDWNQKSPNLNEESHYTKLSKFSTLLQDPSLEGLFKECLSTMLTDSVQGTILSQTLQTRLSAKDFERILPEHIEDNLEELILYLGIEKITNALESLRKKK